MSMQLTKARAIKWLFRHLKDELQNGGCHLYKSNPKECIVCKIDLDMLERVKKVLGA